jgi:hypothetical protein
MVGMLAGSSSILFVVLIAFVMLDVDQTDLTHTLLYILRYSDIFYLRKRENPS